MSEGLPWDDALWIAALPGIPGPAMAIVGIVLVMVLVMMLVIYARRKFAACTAVTTGFVEDYRFFVGRDHNTIAPPVSYQVDGRT